MRDLLRATIRTKPEQADELLSSLVQQESELVTELRRPSETELVSGIRHAVTPLFAAVVTK